MVALSGAAGVALDGGLRGGAADARLVVGGVAHARCGEFGEHRVEGGAGLGGEVAADRGHAVDVLAADGEAAPAGAVVVGEVAVGVEAVGEGVGQLGQLVGAMLAGQSGQLGFGGLARVSMSTKSGSRCQKLRMTATWPVPMVPLRCASAVAGSSGGKGSPFRARALAQIGGVVDAP